MPELYQFSEIEIIGFFLVLVRVSAFIVSWPVFGEAVVPAPVKILLSFAISMIIFPVVQDTALQVAVGFDSMMIIWLFVKEAFVGLSIGFLARLFLHAMNVAGEVVSVSMGLTSAQLYNPGLGSSASANSQVLITLTVIFFLAINGHHLLLDGLRQSFDIIPMSMQGLSFAKLNHFGSITQEIILVGIKMSMPVMISILFMNVTLAVVGRAVPQINVLITSLPINILVGFLVLIISLPGIFMQLDGLIELTATRLFQVLRAY